MPIGKKQNEMEVFANPLDTEVSFSSSPKGSETFESRDDMKSEEAKAKKVGKNMRGYSAVRLRRARRARALFDGVDEDGNGTIDKEEVGGPACMSLV